MSLQYVGLKDINGPLVALEGVKGAAYDEIARIRLDNGTERIGRVVELEGDKVILQVFEGTNGISLKNTRTIFSGRPLEIPLAEEMLGRVFNGAGKPIDGLGAVFPEKMGDVNGRSLNPVARQYPRNYIHTGISSIDSLMTLIRGQKLPIFSGSGLSHNKLAVQIVKQAKLTGSEPQNDSDSSVIDVKPRAEGGTDAAQPRATGANTTFAQSPQEGSTDAAQPRATGEFAIVFAAMGVQNDVADYFRRSFVETGAIDHVCMFLNLSSDPIIERLLTPLCALTAAEYLAFEKNMHILVIMTDMTSYAEALREFSSSKGEIPGRKGYPGYLYSNLASLYERAGVIEGSTGSVTQIPILTMPNDDITHPIPDLTAYITEGQIVFDRELDQKGIYPGLSVLLSLSRLMKDGIGEGYTRADHAAVSNQLFAAYAKVQDARSLASVIGEEELSENDRAYMRFGKLFEERFLNQGFDENRSIDETLDLGWDLLCSLPKSELDRIDEKLLDEKYDPDRAARFLNG